DRARLAGGGDERGADDALRVDHEGRPVGEPLLLEEDAVLLGDRAVRPEVGEEREVVALLLRPGAERGLRVDGGPDELDAVLAEDAEVLAERAQPRGADPREREREEHEHDRAHAAEVAEPDVLAELIGEVEVRSLGVVLECHGWRSYARRTRVAGRSRVVPP